VHYITYAPPIGGKSTSRGGFEKRNATDNALVKGKKEERKGKEDGNSHVHYAIPKRAGRWLQKRYDRCTGRKEGKTKKVCPSPSIRESALRFAGKRKKKVVEFGRKEDKRRVKVGMFGSDPSFGRRMASHFDAS